MAEVDIVSNTQPMKRECLELIIKIDELNQAKWKKYGDLQEFASIYGKEIFNAIPGLVTLNKDIDATLLKLTQVPKRDIGSISADIKEVESRLAEAEARIAQPFDLTGDDWLDVNRAQSRAIVENLACANDLKILSAGLKKELELTNKILAKSRETEDPASETEDPTSE